MLFQCLFLLLSVGMLQTLPVPTAKSYMFYWDTDNFGKDEIIVHLYIHVTLKTLPLIEW